MLRALVATDTTLSLSLKRSPEVYSCTAKLAQAIEGTQLSHLTDALDLMFATPLSEALIKSLAAIAVAQPTLLSGIQKAVLDLVSRTLSSARSFHAPGAPIEEEGDEGASDDEDAGAPEGDGEPGGGAERVEEVLLALSTLATFDFKGYALVEFVRDTVVLYLDNDSPAIRKQAAQTCSKLLAQASTLPVAGQSAVIVGDVLEKLLVVAVADGDAAIRYTALVALDTRFDPYLCQPEFLRLLFTALHDETFEIRELVFTIIGRLNARNPASVMPPLRKVLIQLLTELQFSTDNKSKEESATLLSLLAHSSGQLVRPYVDPIIRTIIPRLRDPSPSVVSCVLGALGEVSVVGDMSRYMGELMPIMIETIQDQSSPAKREVALRTLGLLLQSSGDVVEPYVKYPSLLSILLIMLRTETNVQIRLEIIRLLGILGALVRILRHPVARIFCC